ncbi:MAG: hypothetical protein M3R68_01040 [Acidobacteriota bacterium]|nr:hypothetical protein [Acidobacteriota bacterium]
MESNPPTQELPPAKEGVFKAEVTLVTPKESTGKPENLRLKYFELSVSLIKAAAWPLLALIVLWWLRAPISAITQRLPDMIEHADSVKLSAGTGGVAVELQRAAQAAARAAGRPELAERMGDLSPAAIAELIRANTSRMMIVGTGFEANSYSLPSEEQLKVAMELEKKGLVEFGPMPYDQFDAYLKQLPLKVDERPGDRKLYRATRPLTPIEDQKLKEEYYRLTKNGEQVYKFIVDSIIHEAQPDKSSAK